MPLSFPDWSELSLYVYVAVGGAVAILMALGMHFAPITQRKIPAIVIAIVGALGGGAAGAVISMMGFGWRWYGQHYEQPHEGPPPGSPRGQGGDEPPGRGGPAGRGRPNPKTQLVSLITKLDLVTHEHPAVTLSAEQKRKIRERLQKLDGWEVLMDTDAKEALDAVLEILTDEQKKILNEDRKPGATNPPLNPFKEEPDSEHLKSLRSQLAEKKAQ
jgi:hypothetical protein